MERRGPPSEALLRALPGFVAHLELDGRILFLNRLVPGFTDEQVLGSTIFDFTAEEYREVARACLERAIATRAEAGFSSLGQGAHGTTIAYYTLLAPIIEDGKVTSVVLLATDVSHVTEAYRALEASDAKLRLALEATKMGIWSFDRRTDEVTYDATLSAIVGDEPVVHVTNSADGFRYLHPDDVGVMRAESAKMAATGAYGPVELRVVRPDGSLRWVSATGRVQHSEHGQPVAVVGGVIDITERKLQEEQLAHTQRLESIGRLAGGVAHDFNNMLTAILGYAELCLVRATTDAALVEDLHEIVRAAERSRELTARLLAFARRQRVEQRVIEPNALVQQLDRLLRRLLGEHVVLSTSLRATRNVRIDPHQLEQLLVNLTTNARDAMPGGGQLALETLDVDIDRSDGELVAGPHVRIRVVDTGTGISPEMLAHVFEPFFTTKDSSKGTGLGLAQCYGIARQAGGQLRITTKEGAGTQVTLDLPATSDGVDVAAAVEIDDARGAETILVVEDEAMLRTLTARILRDHGYQVLEARDGADALRVAAAHHGHIALVLTDMVMPGMTGVELADQLARVRHGIAVLVMTGYAPQLGADRAMHVLAKPFKEDELLANVRAALGPR